MSQRIEEPSSFDFAWPGYVPVEQDFDMGLVGVNEVVTPEGEHIQIINVSGNSVKKIVENFRFEGSMPEAA